MGSSEVTRAAARVQQLGDDVRGCADRVLAAGAVRWQSPAAAGFRKRLADEETRLRSVVAQLDEAAVALRAHAVAVEATGRGGAWLGHGGGR